MKEFKKEEIQEMMNFQKSLSANVRRTSLNLLRKIVDNIDQVKIKIKKKKFEEKKHFRRISSRCCAMRRPLRARKTSSTLSFLCSTRKTIWKARNKFSWSGFKFYETTSLKIEKKIRMKRTLLQILSSLLKKDSDLWVNELVRLGVFERVEAIAKPPQVKMRK